MRQSTRIIANTLASYLNSLLALVAVLFSARWVLQALGEVDFGLYGVVGSLVLLLTFLNNGLQMGVARFFAFSIGKGENLDVLHAQREMKYWFSTAFSIHLLLPFILVVVGWPLGEYAIQNWLAMPAERVDACLVVFRISLVTVFVSVFSVPFISLYKAHQLITELALFGLLRSLLVVFSAWLLLYTSGDSLVNYAIYMMAINIGIPCFQVVRAFKRFPSCRVERSYMFSRRHFSELFGFVGWKMFGLSCVAFRMQGAPILVNLFFGPQVNAAYSIADRVSVQSSTLAKAMMGAFQPAITSMEGRGDREMMLQACLRVCKFGSVLVLIFAIPLILEMENVLTLWLGTPPNYAAILCQWMLVTLIIGRFTAGHMLAINACGKIKYYEIVQGLTLLSALPLGYYLFLLGFGPASVGFSLCVTTFVYSLSRLVFCKVFLGLRIGVWFKSIFLPLIVAVVLSFAFGAWARWYFEAGIIRLLITSIMAAVSLIFFSWCLVLDAEEKRWVRDSISKASKKFLSSRIC